MQKEKIMIVDDESKLRRLLSINLTSLNYEVSCASNGPDALELFTIFQPDLILLDIMMPDMDGFEVLKAIRKKSSVSIIFLTARDQLEDKVKGFDLGADDYLAKPFALEELFGRIAALLRRSRAFNCKNTGTTIRPQLHNGTLTIDLNEHRVFCEANEVKLTATEFSLLHYFMSHIGSAITHEQLFAHIWGPERLIDIQVLRVTLARLRQKLRNTGLISDCGIESLSGIGYRMRSL